MRLERFGLGIAKSMAVTFKHLFRKPFTVPYPEKRLPLPRRFRGYEFVWDIGRCTGCATCAKSCPHGVIQISTSVVAEENKYQVERFEIDTALCIFCGLCVEACPFDALFMGTQFERASYQRGKLLVWAEQLIEAEKRPSAYARPRLLAEEVSLPEEAS